MLQADASAPNVHAVVHDAPDPCRNFRIALHEHGGQNYRTNCSVLYPSMKQDAVCCTHLFETPDEIDRQATEGLLV